MLQIEAAVKPFRKEMEHINTSESNPIHVVRPVDQESAPDHRRQDRDIDPVEVTDGTWMLLFEFLHGSLASYEPECGHRLRCGGRTVSAMNDLICSLPAFCHRSSSRRPSFHRSSFHRSSFRTPSSRRSSF